MALSDRETILAAQMGVAVGDLNIAKDLMMRALDAGMEAMLKVAQLHHNPEMQNAIFTAACMAIQTGARESHAFDPPRLFVLCKLMNGEFA